jgi:hypothetical protein
MADTAEKQQDSKPAYVARREGMLETAKQSLGVSGGHYPNFGNIGMDGAGSQIALIADVATTKEHASKIIDNVLVPLRNKYGISKEALSFNEEPYGGIVKDSQAKPGQILLAVRDNEESRNALATLLKHKDEIQQAIITYAQENNMPVLTQQNQATRDATPAVTRRISVENDQTTAAYNAQFGQGSFQFPRDAMERNGDLNTAGQIWRASSKTSVANLGTAQEVYNRMEQLLGELNPPISKAEFGKTMMETPGLADAVVKNRNAIRGTLELRPDSISSHALGALASQAVNAARDATPAAAARLDAHAADLGGQNDFKIKQTLETRSGLTLGTGPDSIARGRANYVIATEDGKPLTQPQIEKIKQAYGENIRVSENGNAVQFSASQFAGNDVRMKFEKATSHDKADISFSAPSLLNGTLTVLTAAAPAPLRAAVHTAGELSGADVAAIAGGAAEGAKKLVVDAAPALAHNAINDRLEAAGSEIRARVGFQSEPAATAPAQATPPAPAVAAPVVQTAPATPFMDQPFIQANTTIVGRIDAPPSVAAVPAPAVQPAPPTPTVVAAPAAAAVTPPPGLRNAEIYAAAVAQATQKPAYSKEDVPTLNPETTKVIQAALHRAGEQCGKHGPKGDGVDGKCGPDTKTMIAKMCNEAGVDPKMLAGPATPESLAAMQKLNEHIGGKILAQQRDQEVKQAKETHYGHEGNRTVVAAGPECGPSATPNCKPQGGRSSGRG